MKLEHLYNLFAKHKESRWIMEVPNARILYNFIKEHPIKRILDLGTGIGLSSAICALALKNKGETEFHIDTIEQFNKCVRIADELIPFELKEYITIHKANVTIWETDKIPHQKFTTYDQLPEGDYDLIINDGPASFMEGKHYIDLPNGTITKLLQEDKIKTGAFVLWDGRIVMLKLLERYYSDNFWLVKPAQRGDDCNILERKDNEILFKDQKLEDMNIQGYFNEKDTYTNNSQTTLSQTKTLN